MIQFNIKTDKGNLRITSPASWRELSLKQLIEIETEWDGESAVHLFSIVTGLDIKLLKNSTEKKLEETMLAICAFAYNQPQWDVLPRPQHIELGGKVYKTPDQISKKMLGQKIMASALV